MITEDFEKLIDHLYNATQDYKIIVEDNDLDVKQAAEKGKDIRTIIRDAIKPQVDIATSVIDSIGTSFDDTISQTKRMKDAIDQIQSWEKQIHGACEQIINTVESKDGSIDREESIVNDSSKCSPMAFNKYIKNYTSRDYSTLELASAIVTFYNSLA
jgi:hypothetical protein